MEIFSIVALTLITAILVIFIKQYRPEMALTLSAGAGAIILLAIISKAIPLLDSFSGIINSAGIKAEYVSIMLKSLGICYLTQFSCDICNDFGQTALGNFALSAGKCTIFIMSVPMLSELLGAALRFIG